MDNGEWITLGFPSTGQWSWNPRTFRIAAGQHEVSIGIREPKVIIDRVFITNGQAKPE